MAHSMVHLPPMGSLDMHWCNLRREWYWMRSDILERRKFVKFRLEPCNIGTHLKVLGESFQMSTNVVGFGEHLRFLGKLFSLKEFL